MEHTQVKCDKFIHMFPLQRCGSHAIGNWLLHQHVDVNKAYTLIRQYSTAKENYHELYYFTANNKYFYMFNNSAAEVIDYDAHEKLQNIMSADIAIGMCHYENISLKTYQDIYKIQLDTIFSEIANTHIVISLRDFKNCVASMIKQHRYVPEHILQFWQERAQEILGYTNYLGNNKVFINYNKWFLDKDYRHVVSDSLGLHFSDIGINRVPDFGQGSSFEGLTYDNKAQEMKVLDRWKDFQHHPYFNTILSSYPTLLALSNEIFGEI